MCCNAVLILPVQIARLTQLLRTHEVVADVIPTIVVPSAAGGNDDAVDGNRHLQEEATSSESVAIPADETASSTSHRDESTRSAASVVEKESAKAGGMYHGKRTRTESSTSSGMSALRLKPSCYSLLPHTLVSSY